MLESLFHLIVKADLFTPYNTIQICEVTFSFHISASLNHSKKFMCSI